MEASTSNLDGLHKFKVVLLGEGAVGKTSVVLRYVENKFSPKHLTTLQASFLTKKLNISGKRVELNIWDTAGQEKFHALGPIYYRDSHGAVLVYDITDDDSFQKVKNWVKELRRMLGEDVVLVVVGNKTDLAPKQRVVPLSQAKDYATSVGALYHESSAKLNQGIEELFLDLSKHMLERAAVKARERLTSARSGSARERNVLVVPDSPGDGQPVNRCC